MQQLIGRGGALAIVVTAKICPVMHLEELFFPNLINFADSLLHIQKILNAK